MWGELATSTFLCDESKLLQWLQEWSAVLNSQLFTADEPWKSEYYYYDCENALTWSAIKINSSSNPILFIELFQDPGIGTTLCTPELSFFRRNLTQICAYTYLSELIPWHKVLSQLPTLYKTPKCLWKVHQNIETVRVYTPTSKHAPMHASPMAKHFQSFKTATSKICHIPSTALVSGLWVYVTMASNLVEL